MRQTTLPDQTAKLIELGFEKPKSISGIVSVGLMSMTLNPIRRWLYMMIRNIQYMPTPLASYFRSCPNP